MLNPCKFRLPAAFELLDTVKYGEQIFVGCDRKIMQRRTVLTSAAFLAAATTGPLCAAVQESTQAFSALGAKPTGARLERIQASPNFSNGTFHNLTPVIDPIDRERSSGMLRFLTEDKTGRRPLERIPSIKTDLTTLADGQMVWFGHSGFYLKLAGLAIAVDPALHACFPLGSFFKPFAGADLYQPRDIPALDLLILTHDHYDHLDMLTMRDLKNRTAHVVCPLGVGAHLEYWGWEAERITEMDWGEKIALPNKGSLTCVPSQHFSGRTLERNTTLWAGFVMDLDGVTLYLSGDGGYGRHFRQIATDFRRIDFAIVEDGQYNTDRAGIHLMPPAWKAAVSELRPRFVMPCHNAKFDLSRHTWKAPLEAALANAQSLGIALSTPLIGQIVALDNPARDTGPWWQELR